MKFYTEKSIQECELILMKKINCYKNYNLSNVLSEIGKRNAIGELKKEKFWLKKTNIFYPRILGRNFYGSLLKQNYKTYIIGHFRFSNIYYSVWIILFILSTCYFTIINNIFIGLCVNIAIAILFFVISLGEIIMTKKEEKFILDLLELLK